MILAVFITVVMSLVAFSMFRFFRASEHALNIEVLGIRALYAANTGADRAISQLYPIDASGVASTACASVDGSNWNIGVDTGLTGFNSCTVSLQCNELSSALISAVEYQIHSTASCGTDACTGSDSFNSCLRVQRSVEVGVRDD